MDHLLVIPVDDGDDDEVNASVAVQNICANYAIQILKDFLDFLPPMNVWNHETSFQFIFTNRS